MDRLNALNALDALNKEYRTGLPAPPPLAELRQQIGGAVARYPRHGDITADYHDWDGVRCLVLTPSEVTSQLLYFHGGGFRIGSPELAAGFASHLAARSRCQIVLPFYSLAPEQPFPNALLDGQSVLQAFSEQALTEKTPLWLGGDSAGGNLAAVLARRFASRIQGVLLLSPWLDLRVQADSFARNGELDAVFSKRAAEEAAALYLQGHSALDGDASPLLANLETMPPCCIAVGGNEVLLDDSLLFADRLRNARRSVSLQVIPDMAHVEPMTTPASRHVETILATFTHFMENQRNPAATE